MDHIIGFILECFLIGGENKAQRRGSYGCMFAVLGAFAVVMLLGLLIVWSLLGP